MNTLKNIFQITAAAIVLTGMAQVAMADTISPETYGATLGVGESVTIRKTVTITEAAPTEGKLDVMFLMDTTGSMGGVIGAAKIAASAILAGLSGYGDLASGTALFNDDPAVYANHAIITSALSTDAIATQTGINGYTVNVPSYGGDGPEEGFHGIVETSTTAWRPGSKSFIIMLGDASDGGEFSAADATAALAADGTTLIGLSYGNGFLSAYDGVAEASGGDVYAGTINPDLLVELILAAVDASFEEYTAVTVSDLGYGMPGVDFIAECVTADGVACTGDTATGIYDRSRERTFEFDVTFTGLEVGVHEFETLALVDGGAVAKELDTITVGEVPEPATVLLFGAGLLGLGILRRRRS